MTDPTPALSAAMGHLDRHGDALTLFDVPDPAAGRALRDRAMALGDNSAAAMEWRPVADDAIQRLAATLHPFTSDEVGYLVDALVSGGFHDPRSNEPDRRYYGGRMRAAQAKGLIEPTTMFRPSSNPRHHGAPKRVWKVPGRTTL